MIAPTPHQELSYAIQTWEGLFQADEADEANWVNGRVIGTMRGVTPAVLAAHRGIPVGSVTRDMMKTVTLREAAEIGVMRFYRGTGLDLLPWGPATAALVDIGWGSGPRQAVLFAQRLAGATADGTVGPETVRMYSNWIAKVGWEKATREVHKMRVAFYNLIIQRNPKWEIYRKGWMRRADSMLPGTPWWRSWADALPEVAVVVPAGKPADLPVVEAVPPASRAAQTQAAVVSSASLIGAGVLEAVSATSTQLQAAITAEGVVKWVLIGVSLIGLAFTIWKIIEERKAPV